MTIGYLNMGYPEYRCIKGKLSDAMYIDCRNNNSYKYSHKILSLLHNKKSYENYFKYHSMIPNRDIDLYHFFNQISFDKKPYLVSFETCVPRVKFLFYCARHPVSDQDRERIEHYLSPLESNQCKYMIALCECTKKLELSLLNACSPGLRQTLSDKLLVLHPPQKILVNNIEEKLKYLHSDILRFIFIGRQFYRKGGLEVLRAFTEIERLYPDENIELIVIGDIHNTADYTKTVKREEIEEAERLVSQNRRILYYSELDNAKLLELIKASNVGLLPTWNDSYGYSVLEMQACGCPVITSNIRALPEINNDECGWMINLPLFQYEIDRDRKDNTEVIRNLLIDGLIKNMSQCIENTDLVQRKSKSAIDRIRSCHDPELYAKKLRSLYIQCLENHISSST